MLALSSRPLRWSRLAGDHSFPACMVSATSGASIPCLCTRLNRSSLVCAHSFMSPYALHQCIISRCRFCLRAKPSVHSKETRVEPDALIMPSRFLPPGQPHPQYSGYPQLHQQTHKSSNVSVTMQTTNIQMPQHVIEYDRQAPPPIVLPPLVTRR
jgi:hypothetical protein